MTRNGPTSLGAQLSPILGGGFFRPLTRQTAPIDVDCAERLAEAADEGGQVGHGEARLLIRDVLTNHPDVQLGDDEGGQLRDMLNKLRNRRLVRVQWQENSDQFGEAQVEILPTLARVIPFESASAWEQQAELYQQPAAEQDEQKDEVR